MKFNHDAVALWGTGISTNADSSAGYQRLSSTTATSLTISNTGASDIDIRRYGTTEEPFVLSAGNYITLTLFGDVGEVEWKRTDDVATTYTISYMFAY